MKRLCAVVFLIAGSLYSGHTLGAGKGAPAVRIGKIGGFIQHLSWAPDGSRFLFTRIHKGKMGLWTMKADGSDLKPLLPHETMPHFDGHWSADSKKIIFVYDRLQGTDGKLQIDVMNADGSEHKNLIPQNAFEAAPRWSPDGKSLGWASTRYKNQQIFIAETVGKNN
jgi:TolB protein